MRKVLTSALFLIIFCAYCLADTGIDPTLRKMIISKGDSSIHFSTSWNEQHDLGTPLCLYEGTKDNYTYVLFDDNVSFGHASGFCFGNAVGVAVNGACGPEPPGRWLPPVHRAPATQLSVEASPQLASVSRPTAFRAPSRLPRCRTRPPTRAR